jgi:hypothetical protein
MDKNVVKALIELSDSWEDADKVICKYIASDNMAEKLAFLKGMFDFSIIASHDGEADAKETDYKAVLSAIVNTRG